MTEKDDMILAALARLEAGLNNLQSLPGHLTSLREEVATLREEVATLREEVATLREGQARLRDDQTTLRVGLMERMDRLQNILNSIQDDVTVSMGRGEHAERVAIHTREELRSLSEIVSGMHKQIAHLQTQVRELRGDP